MNFQRYWKKKNAFYPAQLSTSTSTSNLFSLQSSKFFKQRLHHFLIMSSLKGERKYEVATKHQLIEEPLEPKNSFSKIEVVEQKLSFSFFSFHLPMFFHPRNLLLFKSNLLSFIFSDRCCFLFISEVFAEKFFQTWKWMLVGSVPGPGTVAQFISHRSTKQMILLC